MNDMFRLSFLVEPVEQVKFRKDVNAKQKCQDRDIIMGKTTNPSNPMFPQLQINSEMQNLPQNMVLRVSAVSEKTTEEKLEESLDNLEPHFNKMLQCRETNRSEWHMSKMLEPNQREIPLEGLSLVKVTRGDQKGVLERTLKERAEERAGKKLSRWDIDRLSNDANVTCRQLSDSVVKLFFELLILKPDGSKQCVSWLLSSPIKDLGSVGGSIDVSLISIQSAPVSGGEMMMCFLAGAETKYPQNSYELQIEFFEVDDDERKVWYSHHTITSNQLHKVGQSVAGFWCHVPKYDKGLRGKVTMIHEETSNTYFIVKKVSKKGQKVTAQSNRLQFTFTPLEHSRLKRKAPDYLFPANEYDPYFPTPEPIVDMAQSVPALPDIPTTTGPENEVVKELLEKSPMLEDIIDSVLKSPEHNVELPTNFESEPNDQQIQVTVSEVDHPDLLQSFPGFNLQSPSNIQMTDMYGRSPVQNNPFSPQGNVNYICGTSPTQQNLVGNFGLNSPTSHHGSVSPNFQQQGTSSTYMHQSVASPQQNYSSMLSPPPPSFHQNHQIQSNNSSSFGAQDRTRSRSGGVQQLRVQLYPRQRPEEPQVSKEQSLGAADILGLSPQPGSFLLNSDPMFSPQPNSQYDNPPNWRNSNGGFFNSDGNDVIQVDSTSKPSKNKPKVSVESKEHSVTENSKAGEKCDSKRISKSSKEKSNPSVNSEGNSVIKVEIIEAANKESLDSLTDELKNMKVETEVKKDKFEKIKSKSKANLGEVTDNIDKIKLGSK